MSRRSFYSYCFSHFLYPAFNRLIGRDMYGVFTERKQTEWWSPEEIRALQLRKLQRVLAVANERVPFYRRTFQKIGFHPQELKSLDEFRALPFFISKPDVQQHTEEFIAEGCNRKQLTWHRTGGSTGVPLLFATDPATNAASAATLMRLVDWWGMALGEPHVMFWGSPRFIIRTRLDRFRKRTLAIRHRLMNRRFFTNYNLNPQNMRVYRQMIEKFQPSYIRGMASSLFLFSRFLVAEGLELDRGRPRAVFSSCEQLYDWEKEMIERGLRAPVANTYGVSEHSEIAACPPCGSMHLMEEDVYCELVPLSEDGQTLEIVATQLNNTLTPLIRYRTGDIADRITQGCSCGRGLGILEGLRGRAHDFIVAPDGRFVHGQFFTHLLVFESGIQKYQVIQEELTRFRILLVTGPDYSRESETRVLTGMQSYLGDSIKVQFEYPDLIPLTGAGKHRWIVSKVAQRAAENPASKQAPG